MTGLSTTITAAGSDGLGHTLPDFATAGSLTTITAAGSDGLGHTLADFAAGSLTTITAAGSDGLGHTIPDTVAGSLMKSRRVTGSTIIAASAAGKLFVCCNNQTTHLDIITITTTDNCKCYAQALVSGCI